MSGRSGPEREGARGGGSGRRFAGGALRALATRALDLPSRYGFHLLVAAALGVEQAGRFYIVYSLMTTLSGLGRVGMDRALTRHVAMALARDDGGAASPLLRRVALRVMAMSLVAAGGLYLLAPLVAGLILRQPELTSSLRLATLIVLPQNLSTVVAGALAGLGRVAASQMVYSWLWPGLFCGVALLTGLSLDGALALIALSYLLTAAIGGAVLLRFLPKRSRSGRAADAPVAVPLRDGASLFSVELVQLLIASLPALVLGALAGSGEVGLFALAWRIALLVNLVVSSVAAMAAPGYARLHTKGERAGLAGAARQAILLCLALSLPAVAVMMLAPATLLGLVGGGYESGAGVLRVLALGQLAAAAACSMPELLGMSGRMRTLRRLNILTMAALIVAAPLFTLVGEGVGAGGAVGMAWAVLLSIIINAGGSLWGVRRELGVSPWGWPPAPRRADRGPV